MKFKARTTNISKSKMLSIRIKPEEYKSLKIYARLNKVSIAELGRQMLVHCIEEIEDKE